MNILPAFIAPSVAASALAGLLAFVPNPAVSQIGLAGSMGLAGYSYAVGKTRDDKDKRPGSKLTRDREIRDLHQQLSDLQGRIRKADRERTEAVKARDSARAANEATVKRLKAVQADTGSERANSPVIDTSAYTARLNELKSDIAAKDERISDLELMLNHDLDDADTQALREKLVRTLKGVDDSELREAVAAATTERDKMIAAYRLQAQALEKAGVVYESELDGLGELKEAQDSEALATIQHWKTEANKLQQRIAELEAEARKPDRFGGTGTADVMGNKVIDFFESKGIQFAAHETDPDLDKGLLVSLKPQTPVDLEIIKRLMGELQIATGTFSVPKVGFQSRIYRFRLAVNEAFRPANQTPLTSNLDRLEKTVDIANHIRIVGPSGSGKSVALDNLIWIGRCLWPDAKLDLLDPKYPFTEWSSLEPTVKGAENVVDAVIAIAETMNVRLAEAQKSKETTGIIPEYSRHILAVDEATVALTEANRLNILERKGEKLPAQFGGSLASLLRLGRALNFKGYFLSQSPLVSKVGLNNGDFDNAASVFLNRAIDKALLTELKDLYAPEKLSAIRNELDRRRAAKQEWLALISDPLNDEIYLVEMPDKGFYHARYLAENGNSTFGSEGQNSTYPQDMDKTTEGTADKAASPVDAIPSLSDALPQVDTNPTPVDVLRGRCPDCQEGSTRTKGNKVSSTGKRRYFCDNKKCDRKTFSAAPQA